MRGLRLEERLEIERRPERPCGPEESRKYRLWRDLPGLEDAGAWQRRLDAAGMEDETLRALCAEDGTALERRLDATPRWMRDARAALRGGRCLPPDFAASLASAEETHRVRMATVAHPFLDWAREELERKARSLCDRFPNAPFGAEEAARILLPGLVSRLYQFTVRTVILELHVARLRGDLDGDDEETRFESFLRRCRRPEFVRAFFSEYAVLARLAATASRNWIEYGAEFLEHLCRDRDRIQDLLPDGAPADRLASVRMGAGDVHRNGRSVLVVRFRSGSRVVYKPRSLGVDATWAELLRWVDDRGVTDPHRPPGIVEGRGYGWMEFVAHEPCRTGEELEAFYRRQGSLLALFHLLEATDFHQENLIASGPHPVPVDMESLFHPRLGVESWDGAPSQAAVRDLNHSVLRTGMLPSPRTGEDGRSLDTSGLGGRGGQRTLTHRLVLDGFGTDDMRAVRRHVPIPEAKNAPDPEGRRLSPAEFAGALDRGFTETYRILLRHRDELLAPGGLLDRFAGREMRVIARPTRLYGKLLTESYHPDLLRDALDRDRTMDLLWGAVDARPELQRLAPLETRDLFRGDVPAFTGTPGSTGITASEGEEVPDFLDRPVIEEVREKLRRFGSEDLALQRWFIRSALATRVPAPASEQSGPGRPGRGASRAKELAADRALAEAVAIGDRLADAAYRDGTGPVWLGVSPKTTSGYPVTFVGDDVYDGSMGLALFFAYLAHVAEAPRFRELAEATVDAVTTGLAERPPETLEPGGFTLGGGAVHLLSQVGSLWDRPDLLGRAMAVADAVAGRIDGDEGLDVTVGSAGFLNAALALHEVTGRDGPLRHAEAAGRRLVESAVAADAGRAWPAAVPAHGPLAGYAHGASGIADALLRLWRRIGGDGYRRLALAGFEYEQTLFDPEHRNWRDLRDWGEEGEALGDRPPMTAWCHGAGGVVLARLTAIGVPGRSERCRDELETALRTVLADGFGHNHSLCHGDLGNADILLSAARELGRPELERRARERAGAVVDAAERSGWRCGVRFEVETPGLMCGLAGIGYALLRLAAPEAVPSILRMAPPPGSVSGRRADGAGPA